MLLIEAAGAVGKTAAAEALASTLKWPLVNASKAQVGSYSLSGLIQDALGFNSPFIGDVVSGRAGVIIDALDEAHLKAGTANFLAFLENIRKLSGTPGNGLPSIVLLSRADTAILVKESFAEASCPLTTGRIDFFSHQQAQSYIRSYMSQQHTKFPDRHYDAPVRHPQPFAELLDQRLSEIARTLLSNPNARAVNNWEEAKGFLGYAPVLSVLGEFLAVANPYAERHALEAPSSHARSILLTIISNLLEREQIKFQNQVRERLRATLPANLDWDNFDEIYGPSEQSVRLVGKVLHLESIVPIPPSMPDAIRENYERDARQFTSDHPFVAGVGAVNVVFSDFIMAKAAVDRTCRLALAPDPRGALGSVGPFFYQFVHEFGRNEVSPNAEHAPEVAVITEDLIPIVLDSQSQSARPDDWKRFIFVQQGNEGALLLHDMLTKSERTLDFSVTELSGGLHLPRRLSRGLIVTDSGVILGSRESRFVLGPASMIIADEVVIEAEILSIDPGKEKSLASVISSENISVSGRLSVECPDQRSLIIYSGSSIPAFRPYVRPQGERSFFADYGKLVDLRALMLAFRGGLGESPGVFGELMEKRIIKNNLIRQKYLRRLRELGLVFTKDAHYYLNTSQLAGHGITFSDLYKGEPTEQILAFLKLLDAE
ncbi:hypothetical protein ITP53_48565 [Nonomuraea sp. K274]|uniref:Uncharacterized protein n=1 Tax=Nonomuraea cypriaca TaxID=1187855 RepID=A0A931F485_9ACTN|nr:hypothetical protein [Nonomuraea cypriaca]MBF8193400.1 hypothetical protein [Nonomuraea cypriaca]